MRLLGFPPGGVFGQLQSLYILLAKLFRQLKRHSEIGLSSLEDGSRIADQVSPATTLAAHHK